MTRMRGTAWRWVRRTLLARYTTGEPVQAREAMPSQTPRPEANLVGLQARWLGDPIRSPHLAEIAPGTTGTVTAFVEADSYRTVYQITFDNGATHTTALPHPHLIELLPPSDQNYLGWGVRIRGHENYAPGSTLHTGSQGTVTGFEVGGTGHRAYVLNFPADDVELTTELPAPDVLELTPPR